MPNSNRSNNKKDTAEKEYNYALSLIKYHTELLWQEFGAFLLAETVLIGFVGTILSQAPRLIGSNGLVFGGAIFGLILCFPWWSTFLHNYEYYVLRIAQAKRHETVLGINLLKEGAKLDSGLCIDEEVFRHPWLARKLPPRHSARFLIVCFSIAYSILIFTSGPWNK
jgi:hypothetical protein